MTAEIKITIQHRNHIDGVTVQTEMEKETTGKQKNMKSHHIFVISTHAAGEIALVKEKRAT